ncbi:MAG: N-acetylglucosamine-6-phosphate deacetylase [Clostridia bacterium]|nr:N-acetylglucosamine-6-phosphate deacetylase [Clostridia bacterium]
MLIENGIVFTGKEFEDGLSIRLMNGIVQEVGEGLRAEPGEKVIDLEGDYLLPGFVDVHIHAFRGSDTMRGETDIRRMSRDLAGTGTGAFCPTTMSASMEDTAKVIADARKVTEQPERNGARVLGVHMEAPFLSEKHAGAQMKEYFCDPDWEKLLNMAEDPSLVRLITMAPEREGSEEFIRRATAAGIHVSIGHTDATGEQVHQAADWGADHITHTFNAQTPLHHREPGVPDASMTDDRFYCEMICDGKHLHDDIVRLIIVCKGADKAVAITDAMEAAGMPDGEYSLGGQPVFVKDGAARLENGTLAGSVLTMNQALHNLIHRYGADPVSACKMCTSTPAQSIGESVAGHMVPGSPAILTRWSRNWEMKSVITDTAESCQADR